jgi:type I restriction enzyme M protein
MAIVLPQGRFNNSSDKNIRDFIAERCRILAVVGLSGNTFRPHTGTKTSVLLVQKWNDDPKIGALCPRQDDYNIFFATMQKSGKDNSGEKVYVKVSDDSGDFLLDKHNHWIVDHDLFNHDGLTEDGIAEAFIEFAKKENLSFFEIPPANATPLNKGDRGGAFDAVKYQQLMDRIEASIVKYTKVLAGASTLRFDSEYYKKEFLADERILTAKSNQFEQFSHLNLEVDASAFYPSIEPYYGQGDLPFLRVSDVNRTIDYTNCITIPNQLTNQHSTLKKVRFGDILLTKGGSIARVGFVTQEAAVSRDLIFINSAKLSEEDQVYLFLYFQTDFCNRLLIRSSSQSVQAHLTITLVRGLELFKASYSFKNFLKKLINCSQKELDLSKTIYQQAENLLLTELGLKDWKPTEESIAVKSFSESFLSSGRLDAEYYQPKYDQLYQSLKTATLRNGWQLRKLSELSSLFKYGVSDSLEYIEEGVPFLRIADLNKHRFSQENLKFISNESAKKYKETVRQGDVIISRSGTLGIAVVIPEFLTNAVYGSYFILTRPKKELVLPTYLALYLNSLAGKMQTEQSNTGGIQTNLTIPVLESLVIACPSLESQQKFVNKVHDSYNAEEKSKQLLQIAKIGVEKAIETDEETATAWINQKLESLGVKLI